MGPGAGGRVSGYSLHRQRHRHGFQRPRPCPRLGTVRDARYVPGTRGTVLFKIPNTSGTRGQSGGDATGLLSPYVGLHRAEPPGRGDSRQPSRHDQFIYDGAGHGETMCRTDGHGAAGRQRIQVEHSSPHVDVLLASGPEGQACKRVARRPGERARSQSPSLSA